MEELEVTFPLTLTIAIYARRILPSLIPVAKSVRANIGAAAAQFFVVTDEGPIDEQIKKDLAEMNVSIHQLPGDNTQIQKVTEILRRANTDIVIMTQDDLLLAPDTIQKIMKRFEDPQVNMVCNNIQPQLSWTFFEKIQSSGNRMAKYIGENWNEANYLLANRIMSFRMSAARNFRIPSKIISMDAYFFLENKRLGGKFAYCKDVVVYMRLAQKLSEYRKQSTRFLGSATELKRYFDADFVDREYTIPRGLHVKAALVEFVRHPILFTCYAFLQAYVRLNPDAKAKAGNFMDTDTTTKDIKPIA